MSERRSLIEGLKSTPTVDPQLEKAFVYRDKTSLATHEAPTPPVVVQARSPISTRIRADYASALKKASLERQLTGIEPHTLQDILEQAIEPWLKSNGYLS